MHFITFPSTVTAATRPTTAMDARTLRKKSTFPIMKEGYNYCFHKVINWHVF